MNGLVIPENKLTFRSLEDFELWCAENGLKTQEVTRKEAMQRIIINHDPLDGEMSWKTEQVTGLAAMGIMAQAFISMYEEFSQGSMRVDLGTGSAKIAVVFEDGQMRIVSDNNDIAVRRILAMALAYYIAKGKQQPLDGFAKAFGWNKNSKKKGKFK